MLNLKKRAYWALVATLLVGCGGDDDGVTTSVDAGAPLGEGIVKSIESSLSAEDGLPEGQGRIVLDVFHGDRAVNRKVKLEFATDAARDAVVAKGEGNQEFDLAPGLYFAKITYSEGEVGEPMIGTIAGLKVNLGHVSKYSVVLEAPVGLLQLKFTRSDGPGRPAVGIDEQIIVTVYPEGGDRTAPVWEGKGGENVPLPVGTYDVKATYDSGKGLPTVEWYEGLEIAAGLARTKRDVHLDLDASGVRIDAFNFSRDVNSSTEVYFFNPGALVEQATAKALGKAGESIAIEPGLYDILVVYTPSPNNPDLMGRHKLPNFEVPAREGVRRPLDLQLELAEIRITVTNGEVDVSEQVEIMVKRSGADRVASSSVFEGPGGRHLVAAGTYDLYVEFTPAEGDKVKHTFRGIELTNGNLWAQSWDAAAPDDWVAAAVQRPAAPLRAIDWKPEPVAGDDDDSAGEAEPAVAP